MPRQYLVSLGQRRVQNKTTGVGGVLMGFKGRFLKGLFILFIF